MYIVTSYYIQLLCFIAPMLAYFAEVTWLRRPKSFGSRNYDQPLNNDKIL